MLILSFLKLNSFSQDQSEDNQFYEIAPFYNFKQGALSITFDDGHPIQFIKVVPLLNERNIPATFYIITCFLRDSAYKKMVFDAYLAHHEIGSHTVGHYNLTQLNNSDVVSELCQSQKDINALCGKNYCTSLAYPFGCYNDSITQIAKKYYLSARPVLGSYNSMKSLDQYKLKSWVFAPGKIEIDDFNHCVEYASAGLWLIEIFHGIDSFGNYPIKLNDLRNHLDYVKTLESVMWFATVSSVVKYHEESKSANVVCQDCNDSVYKIRLTHNLNDTIYNLPLSVKLKIPNHWDSIQVSGGEMLTTQYSNGFQYVLFNAKPNNQLVEIRPKTIYSPENNPLVYIDNISPNPFYNFININFRVIHLSYIRFELLDLKGNLQFQHAEVYSEGSHMQHFGIQTKMLKGIYFLKIIITDNKNRQKIVQMLVRNL